MRIAIYGGSFNPPHVGHAMVAAWVGWCDLADEVWLLPTYSHAFSKDLAPFDVRLAMCRAAAAAVGPWVRVDAIESELPEPSYTIDTLDALTARHPEHEFRLLVGADTLDDTDAWKRWDRIEADYRPIVAGRHGYREVPGVPVFPDVSSTEVRRRIALGEGVEQFVLRDVAALLGEHYSKSVGP